VYVTQDEPAALSTGASCDKCITLPEGQYTYSQATGDFELKTKVYPGKYFFVTQKGSFRKVRKIEVLSQKLDIDVDAEWTTLPGKENLAKGDSAPKIAIVKNGEYYDKIDVTLKNLGFKNFEIEDIAILKSKAKMTPEVDPVVRTKIKAC
jgi:hypothetical protein